MTDLAGSPAKSPFLVVCALFLALGVGGCSSETPSAAQPTSVAPSSGSKPTARTGTTPRKGVTSYRLTPTIFDAGEVGHRHKQDFEFTIENTSGAPLSLAAPKPSCGCITVDFAIETPLAPGEKRSGIIHGSFGVGSKKFQKGVLFARADGTQKQNALLRAHLHPGIEFEPNQLQLVAAVNGSLPGSRRPVTIRTIEAARATAPPISIENLRIEEATGVQLTVTPKRIHDHEVELWLEAIPGTRERPFRGYARCDLNGRAFEIEAKGYQYQHLVREPTFLQFGRVTEPATAQTRVAVYSPSGEEFSVREVAFTPRKGNTIDVDVFVEPRPEGGFYVVAQPARPYAIAKGTINGMVQVKTTHPGKPAFALRVSGYYLVTKLP